MPAGDFFGRGVAPVANPFTNYLQPKTMSMQRATSPDWGNVGGFGRGDPFGQSRGDISGAGWQNPIDLFTRQAAKEMEKMAGLTGQPGQAPGSTGTLSGSSPSQYDQAFIDAAREMSQRYGVNLSPALLKSMAHIESGGTFSMPVRASDASGGGASVGMMQVKPQYWGGLASSIGADIYDPIGNIRTGAAIMAQTMAQNGGSWERAIAEVYHPGQDPMSGFGPQSYIDTVNQLMQQYGGMTGGGTSLREHLTGSPATGSASNVIGVATSYVGKVPYVWGGIPGKGQAPTGWDCSGFTYWLDQNYGNGQLPAGSHYQFQYAQQTGNLHGTDQLKPGDLVFFDTGSRGGGGANLNGASHVGMYIGNGQMVHAANPGAGTIISDFNQYTQMYQFLGGMSMSWSGGSAYTTPIGTSAAPAYGYGSGSLFGNWSGLMDPNAAWRSYRR